MASAIVLPWTLTFMIGKARPSRFLLPGTLQSLHGHTDDFATRGAHSACSHSLAIVRHLQGYICVGENPLPDCLQPCRLGKV